MINERVADQAIRYMFMEYPLFRALREEIGILILQLFDDYPTNMTRTGMINMMSDVYYILMKRKEGEDYGDI